jgi:hypothetical protein
MTFNPSAALTIGTIQEFIPEPKKVVEFGNQRYTASRVKEASSTKDFYNKLGIEYNAIDVNTERDSIIMDLNYDLREKYGYNEKFSLVTNIGTSEHIFNQYTCFLNAHNLCEVGGLMYHQLPFIPWVNHGFFNYNPIFFNALAYANGYEVVMFVVCDREGVTIDEISDDEMFKEKHPHALENALKKIGRNVFCNVVLKKVNDEEFKMPFQGKYLKDIEAADLKEEYVRTEECPFK